MFVKNRLSVYAFWCIFICLLMEASSFAHMGITPFKVLGNMERQGTGPFALSKPNSQDAGRLRLGVKVEQDSYGDMQGLVITSVRQKSPAANAGIINDDFIASFNSGRVRSVYDLEAYIKRVSTGETVPIVVFRDGVKRIFYVAFSGAYEKSRMRVGPSAVGISGNVGPGKMFEKIKNKEVGPNQVFKKMQKDGTGPFSVMRNRSGNKANMPNYQKDAPIIPLIDSLVKQTGDKPVLPPIEDSQQAGRVDLDVLMGDFSMYIENSEALELSAQQLNKIKKLDAEQKKKNLQKETQLRLVQAELGKIFSNKDIDFVAVKRLLDFASDVERDWRMGCLDSLKSLYSIFTPKQKALAANPS